MLNEPVQRGPENLTSSVGVKAPWERPEVITVEVEETDTGFLIGPEIVIALS